MAEQRTPGRVQRSHGGLQGDQTEVQGGSAVLQSRGVGGVRHDRRIRVRVGGERRRHEEGGQDAGEEVTEGERSQGTEDQGVRVQGPDPGGRGDHGAGALPRQRQSHPHHAARFQPHVPDERGGHAGRLLGGLPPSRDGPGDIHQLQERVGDVPSEAALRHSPDRQGVPQRDHPAQLHIPQQGVRADGDRVLHPPRRRRLGTLPPEMDRRCGGVPQDGGTEGGADGVRRPRGGRPGALREGVHGHHVSVPVRGAGAHGHRGEGGLRPEEPHRGERQGS
mmetsp:Transcript_22135/g.47569  ORF Transcript_22135/g.47569 Transcript_22135/m.47569 type:complete len:278 (+) Transcript_22135:575-1408(+)